MKPTIGRVDPPLMVKLALWPNMTRETVLGFFWASVALGTGFLLCGFFDSRLYFGGVGLFAAVWYFTAIQWMDRNRGWASNRN